MTGRSLLEFVHPDDRYLAGMAISSAANGVPSERRESRWLCKDGSVRIVAWSAREILGMEGRTVVLVSGADVTERREQEEEIRASRSRIVEAGDEARRRLERNLHDGAQQRLVALALSLRLAQSKVSADPAGAEQVLVSAREELAAALDDLRELARGIHPAVLTDRGLGAAVEALATRSPVPVDVETTEEPLPRAVEAAAYYVIAESLANVSKYAEASEVTVRVSHDNGCARIEVADDGVGGADAAGGSGLRGLADRVAALEGTLTVESPPGGGTRVSAEIPLRIRPARVGPAVPEDACPPHRCGHLRMKVWRHEHNRQGGSNVRRSQTGSGPPQGRRHRRHPLVVTRGQQRRRRGHAPRHGLVLRARRRALDRALDAFYHPFAYAARRSPELLDVAA